MAAVYLDSSAIVKLAVREPESDALRRHLRRRRPWVSSALARTEVLRSLLASGEDAVAAGRAVLARCDLVRVNDRVLNLAGTMGPAEVRSLDAIHLATAERLRDEVSEVVVYDQRMADAARQRGHRVASPR
jgi:predicted nucleic acid-binding protein